MEVPHLKCVRRESELLAKISAGTIDPRRRQCLFKGYTADPTWTQKKRLAAEREAFVQDELEKEAPITEEEAGFKCALPGSCCQ